MIRYCVPLEDIVVNSYWSIRHHWARHSEQEHFRPALLGLCCFDYCFLHHYKRLQHQDPDRDVRLFHEPGGLREDAVRVEPIGKSAIGAALAHIRVLSNL